MIVVIPSCFNVHLNYLEPLIAAGARFIVIDDSDGQININHPQFEVYNWSYREKILGKNQLAVPKGNGACRNLGFLLAWKEAAKDEVIIALDDDCIIKDENFANEVVAGLNNGKKKVAKGNGAFMNIFDVYENLGNKNLFPRGFPYQHRLGYNQFTFDEEIETAVHFNLGIWTGVLDLNAIDRMTIESNNFENLRLRQMQAILPAGVKSSLCAANMHFRCELSTAIFQPPMNVTLYGSNVVNRMADIWGGYCLKNLMDIVGHKLAVGGPLVWHHREGNFQKNVGREILAYELNNEMIELYDSIASQLQAGSYEDMMQQFCNELKRRRATTSPLMNAYLEFYIASLSAWLLCLKK